MGNCCSRSSPKRYEGVNIPISPQLSSAYSTSKTLEHNDVKIIMKQMVYIAYNSKIYDKESLCSQRAKLVKEALDDKYVKLIEKTKDLEDECMKNAEIQVLEQLKIDEKTFKNTKSSMNEENLIESVTLELLKDIESIENKLSMNEEKIKKLNEQYSQAYSEAGFHLNSVPEVSMKISKAWEHGTYPTYLSYQDILTSDKLYATFGLLPIETQAFLDD